MANIFDLIVRLTGNGQGLRDDVDEDIAKIEELRSSIQDKDMTVAVDATQADEQLDSIKARVADLHDVVMDITAEDPEANTKLDELKVKADELKDLTMRIQVFDKDIAVADLDELSVKAEEFRVALADIPVKLLDTEAQAKIAELKAELDSLHDKTVVVDVKEEKSGSPVSDNTGSARGLVAGGLLTAAPLASPLLGDAVGGIGGLASGMAPGMAGMAGFGAVAVSELKPVFSTLTQLKQLQLQYNSAVTNAQKLQALKQEQALLAQLDTAQRQALVSAQNFGQFWTNFKQQFQASVLSAFTNTLQILKQLLTDLAPAIHGFADAFVTLGQNASKALGAPFWKSFFSWLGANAKASTMTFGESLGNLSKGFAALLMAFQPLAKDMEQGWVKMTASFANWASHLSATQGFQQFLTYVKQTGPQVLNLIGQLIQLAVNLLEGMAPLGQVLITIVDTIARWINGLIKLAPWLKQVAGAAAMFGGVLKLAIAAVGGPWGLLIAAIVTGVIEIIAHWGQIAAWAKQHFGITLPTTLKQWSNLWNTIWHGIQTVFTMAWNDIKKVFQSVWVFIGPAITNGVKAIAAYWVSIWPELKQVFIEVWNAISPVIKTIFAIWTFEANTFFKWLRAIWKPFWAAIGDVLKAAWTVIEGVIKIAWNVISGLFKVALDLLTGQWGKAWTDLKTTLSNVWKDIVQMFDNFITDAENFGKNFIQAIINGAESMVQSAIGAIGNVINSIKSAVGLGGASVTASVTSSSTSTVNVVHSGSVTVAGLTPRAVQQVNQHLYTTAIRK